MKNILTAIVLITTFTVSTAQNANDALRYSLLSYSGTARFMGLSGAYGAIGADFSSLSQNPAGIAVYRKSEFTITPGLFSASTESEYFTRKTSDSRTNVTLGNLGMVFAYNLNESKPDNLIKGLQLGFGMNRQNQFGNRITVNGFNTDNSLLALYEDEADNGGNPINVEYLDPFSTLLAYDANLLVFDSGNITNPATYWVDMRNSVLQHKSIETMGSSNEMVLSGGMNLGHRLYLGITLGFPSIRYEETSYFTEKDDLGLSPNSDPDFNFKTAEKSDYMHTKGNGFNMKFGFIFKPVEFLRIGGALHTPTTYNLTDEWNSRMVSYFENGSRYSASSPDGYFDYKVKTPLRALGSLGIIIGNYGFISADYEYIDYSTASLNSYDYDFFSENNTLRTDLRAASNWRFGAEFKYNVFAFRVGSSYYGSPYEGETTRGARMGYSGGIGIREKGYFLDFSYNHLRTEDNYYLYGTAMAENKYYTNQFLATLGFRF